MSHLDLDSTTSHLQHTATHYNTLQHTATHCNTLQYATTSAHDTSCRLCHGCLFSFVDSIFLPKKTKIRFSSFQRLWRQKKSLNDSSFHFHVFILYCPRTWPFNGHVCLRECVFVCVCISVCVCVFVRVLSVRASGAGARESTNRRLGFFLSLPSYTHMCIYTRVYIYMYIFFWSRTGLWDHSTR